MGEETKLAYLQTFCAFLSPVFIYRNEMRDTVKTPQREDDSIGKRARSKRPGVDKKSEQAMIVAGILIELIDCYSSSSIPVMVIGSVPSQSVLKEGSDGCHIS